MWLASMQRYGHRDVQSACTGLIWPNADDGDADRSEAALHGAAPCKLVLSVRRSWPLKREEGKSPDRSIRLLDPLNNQLRRHWLRSQIVEPLSSWRRWQHNRKAGRPPFAPRKDPAAQQTV